MMDNEQNTAFTEQQRRYARAVAEDGSRLFDPSAARGEPAVESLGARAVLSEIILQQSAASFEPGVVVEIVPNRRGGVDAESQE